jgi:hypothetical protein
MFGTKVVEKIKAHNFVQYIFSEKRTFYKKVWKSMVQSDWLHMTTLRRKDALFTLDN